MEFDKSKVYTAVNADELRVGSQVICDDDLADLRMKVETNNFEPCYLLSINDEFCVHRFVTQENRYALAYLVSEPAEKKLKWTDLKVGDIIRKGGNIRMVIGIDTYSGYMHIYTGTAWLEDEDLAEWEKVND